MIAVASLLVVAIAALAACGSPAIDDGASALRETSSPIADGYVDADDTFVVAFYNVSGGSLCSGALIASNVVLTARHCVSPTVGGPDGKVECGATTLGELGAAPAFLVTTAPTITIGNAGEYLTAEVLAPAPVGADFCGNDIAALVLAENVDPMVAKPIEPRVVEPVVEDETYSAIGYGATNDQGDGAGTRRRRDGLLAGCVGDGCSAQIVAPTEWRGEEGVCQGDSGGPAIDAEGRVIGVTSRGSVACTSPVYGHVPAWAQWLKDTVTYASGLGEYAAPPWTDGTTVVPEHSAPVGEACASDEDCFTGRCVEQGGYCTRACTDAARCPEGYLCEGGDPATCVDTSPPVAKSAEAEGSGCAIASRAIARAPSSWAALALLVARCVRRRRRAP